MRLIQGLLLIATFTAAPSVGAQTPTIPLETYVTGLNQPVAVRSAFDGSDRLFVLEQDGIVRVVTAAGAVLPEPFLDLSEETGLGLTDFPGGNSERGLLGIVFHPEYESNGLFYVNYTDALDGNGIDNGDTVIHRFSVDPLDADRADGASGLIVTTIGQDFGNHNGGDLHFGPDGYLYIGMGDGGSAGDPNERAQDPASLLGKMLRIDVDPPFVSPTNACGPVQNYGVPPDNPFVGQAGVCAEIWALGLRNPFRFSFDAQTGDLWIGDVGQGRVEEVNLLRSGDPAGANLGWDCREGDSDYGSEPGDPGAPSDRCDTPLNPPLVEPVVTYSHSSGRCSVTGGYRYRGPVPSLQGLYIAADFCTGELLVATEEAGGSFTSEFQQDLANISSFGEDEARNLYVVDRGTGTIHRVSDLLFRSSFEAGE